MNIKAAIKYQINDFKKPVLIYYTVIILVNALFFVLNTFSRPESSSSGGIEAASIIFLFIAGLNSFKSTFHLFSANGISRKTLFIGTVLTGLAVCGVIAAVDTILGMALINYNSLYFMIFKARYGIPEGIYMDNADIGFGFYPESFIWYFSIDLMLFITGFFITTLYYRMNKISKICVSVGIPVFFTIILPFTDTYLFKGAVLKNIINFFIFIFNVNNPYISILFFIAAFLVISAVSFIFIRKAPLKV